MSKNFPLAGMYHGEGIQKKIEGKSCNEISAGLNKLDDVPENVLELGPGECQRRWGIIHYCLRTPGRMHEPCRSYLNSLSQTGQRGGVGNNWEYLDSYRKCVVKWTLWKEKVYRCTASEDAHPGKVKNTSAEDK